MDASTNAIGPGHATRTDSGYPMGGPFSPGVAPYIQSGRIFLHFGTLQGFPYERLVGRYRDPSASGLDFPDFGRSDGPGHMVGEGCRADRIDGRIFAIDRAIETGWAEYRARRIGAAGRISRPNRYENSPRDAHCSHW